jgi:hypothetical protein
MASKLLRSGILTAFAASLLLTSAHRTRSQTPSGARDISLDGEWHFVTDPTGRLELANLAAAPGVRAIRVPSSWQTQFADLRDYAGVAWYWRSFEAPALKPGQAAILHFGAVDYRAVVYVNGREVGSHDGGYLPFHFDVTSLLHAGKNRVAVRVADPGPHHSVEGIHYSEIPHGKQDWYVETSGLWQSVTLEIRPRMHFGVVHITAPASGDFRIEAHIENPPSLSRHGPPVTVQAKIFGPNGKVVWQAVRSLNSEQGMAQFSGSLLRPSLWSPDHPALYSLRLALSSGDDESYRFGFRTFQTRGGKFYLNGQVIYLRGALDQDFFPATGYTPPSLGYIQHEMVEAKSLGLNLLRCHIDVPDPRYLDAADETGMLIWYEIPNWDKLTPDSESRATETLRGMVQRDWNHPSIVQVSIINESWGVNLQKSSDRAWLKNTWRQAKQIVPGWRVDDNSPCCNNFHISTDLADFHNYDAIPDHAAAFDRFVAELASRPKWLFSPYGDAAPKGDEPLVLSEFGNWGLPVVPEPRPWWFSRSFDGRRITLPAGFQKRFEDYGYGSLFPSLRALSIATQWHEFRALQYEIGSLRMHPQIQGYVITEFTDTDWESNGLMDMWRHPKVFAARLAAINQDDSLVLRAHERNFYSGAEVKADAYFSHYSERNANGARLDWSLAGTSLDGRRPLPEVFPGSVTQPLEIKFTAPAVKVPTHEVLKARVTKGGQILAVNSLDLFFYPHARPASPPTVEFDDPTGQLRPLAVEMRRRGYPEAASHERDSILIASHFDSRAGQALESGGRVILLATDPQTISPALRVIARKGNLGGDWISDFPWVRKSQAPFEGIGFSTLQGIESEGVTPPAVVRGIPPDDFKDVLAGVFFGWLHQNVGTLVQARYQRGRLLICTFSLGASYGKDPYATALLDRLVRYAASDFTPQFRIAP